MVTIVKKTYTAYPLRMFRWTEKENMDVARAGPTVLAIAAAICDSPFVAPSDRLLGVDDVMYM